MTKTQGRRQGLAVLGLLLPSLLFVCPGAWGADAGLDVSQYAHTAWKMRDGFTQGWIVGIAQTPDGYLWLGTQFGLYRFDGVRAVPWQPPAGEPLPSNYIRDLLVAGDGTLWIGTLKGLASWKDGRLTQYPEVSGEPVGSLLQDRKGTVWFGAYTPGRLCAVQGGKIECYGAGSFGSGVFGLYQDHEGNLWAAAATGVWQWKPGPPKQYTLPRGVTEAEKLIEDENGTLLLATSDGLKQLVGGKIQNYALPGLSGRFRPDGFLRSRDGSLWIGSYQGLLHLHKGRTDTFRAADGLSGDTVSDRILEDREGNVWVSTLNGLDRFREYAFPRISRNQGLSASTAFSVQATADGTIWVGTSDGLNRWQDGHVTVYGKRSVGQGGRRDERGLNTGGAVTQVANSGLAGTPTSLGLDDHGRLWVSTGDGVFYFEGGRFIRVAGVPGGVIFGIAGDGHGKEWISHSQLGLFHSAPGDAVQPIPWSRLGHQGYGAKALAPDRLKGGVWLGFYEGGILYFRDGQVLASYTGADGLGNGSVDHLRFGPRGTLWAATESGLSRIRDGRILTLTSKNGLPCDKVHWSEEDDDHSVWVFQPCGLARIARSELDAWVSDPNRKVHLAVFDNSDGVTSVGAFGGLGPTVTKSPDGKIWFVPYDGVSVIDPLHLPYNKVPPPVYVEQITADRKTYDPASYANGRVPLPAQTRDLEIDYTALSYAAPEKVRFRYMLEGRDSDWQDAGNRRQAFYGDLPPRSYRFRVMACNNSGVWNETGAFMDFSVAPAYYQTWWFRLSLVGAFLVLLWAAFQLRLQQLAYEYDIRVEERVGERTRIARELHDSLLQGFQGMMFRLQAGRDLLPGRASEAAKALDIALERGDQAIAEGRDTVSGLREPIFSDKDIAAALTALGEELAAQCGNGSGPCVRVLVEGKQRELNPELRDEIYRIGREAMRNAFHHARAQKIESEITYGESEFSLNVRDDGSGIDPAFANQGSRAGHWGLPGMRERAKSFGGKLEVWSESGAGTEIELTVPAAVAYGGTRAGRGARLGARRKFWSLRKKIGVTDGKHT